MKAYVIECNNGEPYGDNMSWVESVFTTIDRAREYLLKKDYRKSNWNFGKGEQWEREYEHYHNTLFEFATILEFELDNE